MKILLTGSGGREHAFAWKLSQSPLCEELYIAPGNAGTSACGTNIPIGVNDFEALGAFCLEKHIDLLVVGPEDPLVKGIRNFFEKDERLKHIAIVGPGLDGALLEGSKDFSKSFMKRHHIPTAGAETFDTESYEQGVRYLQGHSLPIVLKADGLAAGKGVVICQSHEEALEEFEAFIKSQKFGEASKKVLVEEFLDGIEISVFVLSDGKNYKILPSAKDYKRVGEKDSGPNTGGMGAVSPVPFADERFMKTVEESIIKPTMQGLLQEQIDYRGFIFIGLMNVQGKPYVIEYNCRMGDPETEVVLPRIKSDLVQLLHAAAIGKLDETELLVDEKACVTVMLVSGGYPGSFEKGKPMSGWEQCKNSLLFHAGTTTNAEGHILSNGGRVLAISSYGQNIADAIQQSLRNAELISFENKYYRKDIGYEFI